MTWALRDRLNASPTPSSDSQMALLRGEPSGADTTVVAAARFNDGAWTGTASNMLLGTMLNTSNVQIINVASFECR